MSEKTPVSTIKRIGGYLHKVIPVLDSTGKIISYTLKPLMVEFRLRDLLQIIVGASLLAIPIAFTEETWDLGERLNHWGRRTGLRWFGSSQARSRP